MPAEKETLSQRDRRWRFSFLIILAVALLLRVAGINFGLPHIYHQDEPIVVNQAMAIGAAGWNTRLYMPPQFASYWLFLVYVLVYVVGRGLGYFLTPLAFGEQFIADPSLFYLAGRGALGIFFGMAAVVAIGYLGRRFFSQKIGLLSALFLAVLPLHVLHSHFIYMDTALSFACILFFYALFLWMDHASMKRACFAGLCFGFAVSVKYTAAYWFALPVLAELFSGNKIEIRYSSFLRWLGFSICALACYFLVSPYTFLDWAEFKRQVLGQAGARGNVGFFYHWNYSIWGGSGKVFMISAVMGAVAMLGKFPRKAMLLLVAFGIYYWVNARFSQPFARYMMPIVPILCLFSAFAVWEVFDRHRTLARVLAMAIVLEMLVVSASSDFLFFQKDTRTQAFEWFQKNVPPGSVVVLDNRFFTPPLRQTKDQIREKYAWIDGGGSEAVKRKRLDILLAMPEKNARYTVYTLRQGPEPDGTFLFMKPYVEPNLDSLRKINAEYFVLNTSDSEPSFQALKNSPSHKKLVSFSPYRDTERRETVDPASSTGGALLAEDICSRKSLGPYLEIYRVEK